MVWGGGLGERGSEVSQAGTSKPFSLLIFNWKKSEGKKQKQGSHGPTPRGEKETAGCKALFVIVRSDVPCEMY